MGKTGSKAVWGAALALWVMIPAAAMASGAPGEVDRLLKEAATSGAPRAVIGRVRPGANTAVENKIARRGKTSGDLRFINAVKAP